MPREHGPNYWDYLRLPQLLELQGGLESEESQISSDELHFIVVHQVFELWFKLILRELRLARDRLARPQVPEDSIPEIVHHLRRVCEILRQATEHFRLMETLLPQDFLEFRDKLVPASGFQSFQMREMEILLGLTPEERNRQGGSDPVPALLRVARAGGSGSLLAAKLQETIQEKSLLSALEDWLYRTPIHASSPQDEGDAQAVQNFLEQYLESWKKQAGEQAGLLKESLTGKELVLEGHLAESHQAAKGFLMAEDVEAKDQKKMKRVRAALLLIECYRQLPLLAWPRLLLDSIVEMEEQFVLFRTRHARMVERVIGRRMGTGGSSGVDYLEQTTRYRVFRDLWTVRTLIVRRDVLPTLEKEDFYGFARRLDLFQKPDDIVY